MESKRRFPVKKILFVIAIVAFFFLGAISYAYFSVPEISGNASSSNVTTLTADFGNVTIEYLNGNVIATDTLLLAKNSGDAVSMLKFFISNSGSVDHNVTIHWYELINDFCQYESEGICTNDSNDTDVRDELNYTLYECSNSANYYNADLTYQNGCTAISEYNTPVPTTDSEAVLHTAENITLSGNTTRYYVFYLTVQNKETLQNYQQNKSMSGTIRVDFAGEARALSLSEAILRTYTAEADTNLNFGAISSYSNGQGLYLNTKVNIAGDPTAGTIKYFRGGSVCSSSSYTTEADCTGAGAQWSTLNNYVEFAGMRWRILTINADNNVRIVSEESVIDSGRYTATGVANNVEGIVGYTFNNTAINAGDGTSSRIRTELLNFYQTTLLPYDQYIYQNALFCNDTSYTASGSTLLYGARTRFDNGGRNPTYSCPETSSLYGGLYITKIGTLSADEVGYAGGRYGAANSYYFLNNGTSYWTMSPYSFFGASSAMLYVSSGGDLKNGNNTNNLNTRAVIELKPETTVTGEGTNLSPWIVVYD